MEGEKECSPAGSNPIWQKASEHLDLPFILGEGIGSKSKPEELYEDSDPPPSPCWDNVTTLPIFYFGSFLY